MRIDRNIPYRESDGSFDPALNTLDIYYERLPSGRPRRPVVVFIHGGNWVNGDKSDVNPAIPEWFVSQNCVFVSVNFRLPANRRLPGAEISDTLSDIAKAIKWLTINGRRYGGDNSAIILLGYSSGAHLASLIATDHAYLHAHRLPSGNLCGIIAIDVPYYDIPAAFDIILSGSAGISLSRKKLRLLMTVLGNTPALQLQHSPVTHIGSHLSDTSFLLFSAGLYMGSMQSLTQRMSAHFTKQLRSHNIHAEHIHLEQYEHTDFMNRFSQPDITSHIADLLRVISVARSGSSLT